MRHHVLVGVVAVMAAATLTVAAMAAVAPGTYKGSLYAAGKKISGSPATVAVVGKKVTIKAPKFPIKCLAPTGAYTMPSAPMKYEFKGTLNGNKVSGDYRSPVGGTGEYFTAKGTFTPATKSFTGKLTFTGYCRGTSTIKAKKA
jgi:hypothetical protein